MINEIYFCNDGILRTGIPGKQTYIPIDSIQTTLNLNDMQFWFKNWNANVTFESGLTLFKFLQNLSPWFNFLSEFTGVDIESYYIESRKPTLKKSQIDWLGVHHIIELDADVEFEDDLSKIDNINLWLNSEKNKRLNGKWNLDSYYKVSGYKYGENEHYSIDHTPFNEIANALIYLDMNSYLQISDINYKEHIGKDLLPDDTYGFIKYGNNKILVGEKNHKFKEVVEAFFWWIPRTIKGRDAFVSELMEISKEIHHLEIVNDEHEVVNNDKKTISVLPGAFEPIIENMIDEENFINHMTEKCKKIDSSILKVGSMKTQEPPENRIFNELKNESEFKIIPTAYIKS